MLKKCPSCGEALTVKREKIYTGFKVSGWRDRCLFCGTVVAESGDGAADAAAPAAEKEAAGKLAALLGVGGEDAAARPVLEADPEGFRFCRLCRHYLKHPFTPRCALDNRAIDPMGECGNFRRQED